MPANDSMPHRGASAVRGGHRFAPYQATESTGLKPHASCPTLSIFSNDESSFVSSPEDTSLDSATEISSTATLVNHSFDCDKSDSPPSIVLSDFPVKLTDKFGKCQQRQALHQKKVDYVSQLIDFACANLNEIWPTSSVPAVFRYQHGANFGYTPETNTILPEDFKRRKCETDLIPLRKFVQELLRRSRSTCSTLQTALCYIEAVRHKIPDFQKAEMEGKGIRGEQVNNEGRIEIDPKFSEPIEGSDALDQFELSNPLPRKGPTAPSMSLPPLPSALLCPRRTFMGALVLSAKFVQDKCYSNRAWAKLCGLPAREVSRCERALGDALEWRLWVGKNKGFAFAHLEAKLGRAPTMLQACPAIDDRKDCIVERSPSPLKRAQTWPIVVEPQEVQSCATVLISSENDFSISPTPSLSFSSTASSSSGSFSPTDSSPLPSFVTNDPCSYATKLELTRMRLSNFFNRAPIDIDLPMFPSCGDSFANERDAFVIRGGDGIQVA